MATTDQYTIRGDLQPARKAVRFLGGDTDDVLESAAPATSAVAAQDSVGTFTAWIMMPNTTETACTICGFGDTDADELLQFAVKAGLLTLTITDGGVAQVVAQEDAVGLKPHTWHHVAVVGGASTQASPQFYIDGVLTASTNDTNTDVDEWINDQLDGLDNFTIGMAKFNNTTVQEFKGYISDVKYWTTDLTAAEIIEDMKGSTPETASLQHHWKFDNDFTDAGLRADTLTNTGDNILCNAVSEFDSRLTFATGVPVVADKVCIAMNDNMGFAYVIQAA